MHVTIFTPRLFIPEKLGEPGTAGGKIIMEIYRLGVIRKLNSQKCFILPAERIRNGGRARTLVGRISDGPERVSCSSFDSILHLVFVNKKGLRPERYEK